MITEKTNFFTEIQNNDGDIIRICQDDYQINIESNGDDVFIDLTREQMLEVRDAINSHLNIE